MARRKKPPATLSHQLRDRIERFGGTVYELAAAAEVDRSILSRFLRGERTVKLPGKWHGFFGAIWHDDLEPRIVTDPCGQVCLLTAVARGKGNYLRQTRRAEERFRGVRWPRSGHP
jgi:hypothetical protein